MTKPKIKTYDVGDVARLSGEFRDNLEALMDPDTVVVTMTDPAGIVTTVANVKDSTGKYHADFTVILEGDHHYRFEGTGTPGQSAEENMFAVRKRRVATP